MLLRSGGDLPSHKKSVPAQLVGHLRTKGKAQALEGTALGPPLPCGVVRDVRNPIDVRGCRPMLHGPRPVPVL